MATNFPSSLDTLTNPIATDSQAVVSHADQHANVNDAVEALESKVGVNSSGVTTSHDYKLSEVISSDKAVGKTATQTLTNKTINSASNTLIIATPVGANDAVNKAYADGLVTGISSWKHPVRAATTTNGTLATAYENGDTIDGVVLATGDRILIKDQTTGSENGIYVVNATGAPTRSTDADAGTELVSAAVFVSSGTVNADRGYTCTNDSVTIGVTSITFVQFNGGGSGGTDTFGYLEARAFL